MKASEWARRPRLVAAIPCYNEAELIGSIVTRLKKHVDQVLVVDDGSTDDTANVAKFAGATVIRHGVNRGPGMAYKSCLEAARANGADILITLDGDGQHAPAELPRLLEPLATGQADVVIGCRFLDHYEIPGYRKFGIDVITWLYNLGSDVKLVDAQSCYRGYNRSALECLRITERGFGFSVELLVQARDAGLVIEEVPISCIYNSASHSINPVIHGVGVAVMVVKHRVKSWWDRLQR